VSRFERCSFANTFLGHQPLRAGPRRGPIRAGEGQYIERPVVMVSIIPELEAALAELEKQGLTVRLHSGQNNTWHIADGGLYSGYVVSGNELVNLRKAKKLTIRGIKDLG
jgi:hypothetical protein